MIEFPPLPYDEKALEPHLSARTLSFHHGKHHKTYVDTLNKLIKGTPYEDMELVEIIRSSAREKSDRKIFNNAAQSWNHDFLWHSMRPKGGGKPGSALLKKIEADFDSFESFTEQFGKKGAEIFGTGWLWLVMRNDKLSLFPTEDADNPLTHGMQPLFCVDVWEHAYYLDYQNKRPDYLKAFIEHLVNWDFAAENLSAITSRKAA